MNGPKAKDSSQDSNHSDELATNDRKNAEKTTKYWGGHDKKEEHKFWDAPSKKKPKKGGLMIQAEEDKEEGPLPHDGIIRVQRKIYRPPVASEYQEPELPDTLEESDWIYRDFGKSLAKHRKELPPRDDVIKFKEENDLAELMQNIKLDGCPEELKPTVIKTVKDHWDVFATEGLRKHIEPNYLCTATSAKPPP